MAQHRNIKRYAARTVDRLISAGPEGRDSVLNGATASLRRSNVADFFAQLVIELTDRLADSGKGSVTTAEGAAGGEQGRAA